MSKGNTTTQLNEPILKDIEDPKTFEKYWSFFIKDGVYWFTEYKGKKMNNIRISNFVMSVLYHLNDGTNNTKRIIKIQKSNGQIFIKEVYSNEMTNEKFETILKSVSCTFKGSSHHLKSIFEYLMQTETTAKSIESLGYQKESGVYAFADCVINKDNELLKVNDLGIIQNKEEIYYLPAFSFANIDNDYYSHDRNFKYIEGKADFKEWSALLYKTFGINGAIGISYAIASIFRDIVFNELKYFPFPFLFGQFGTGKTSYIESILHLFGGHTIGTPLSNVTVSAMSRETSQRINSLFYYKEFTIDNAENANPFILNAYDGSGRTIGEKSTDNKTKKFLPQSGIFFDGNYLPIQKDAVFSRLILLMFEENRFTQEQRQSFSDLAICKEGGLCQVTKEILKHRSIFKKDFSSIYKQHLSEVDDLPEYKEIPSRIKNHASLITTVYDILHEKLKFPYSFKELLDGTLLYMIEQSDMLEEIKDLSNFWKAAEYSVSKGFLSEDKKDFIKSSIEEAIYIKYDAFYSAYLRYVRDNDLNRVDKTSLRTLLTSKINKSFVPSSQGSRKSKATTKSGLGSAYKFIFTTTSNGIKINNLELNL